MYATATPNSAHDPKGKGFDPNWFDTWYNVMGGKQYLMNEPRSEEGRLKIAQWNGWGQHWKDFVKRIKQGQRGDQYGTSDWIYYLALHFARHGSKWNVYCGIQEGMHRSVGLIQAALNAHLNIRNGSINPSDKPMSARVMVESGVVEFNENKPLDDTVIKKAIEEMNKDPTKDGSKDGSGKNRMVNETLTANAHWINNKEAHVPKVMKALRFISQAISNEKRTSSHRSATTFIADDIYAYLSRITTQSIESIPNFSQTCKAHQRTAAAKYLNEENFDEETAFPSCTFLQDECMKKYIDNPFNEQHIKDVEKMLACDSFATITNNDEKKVAGSTIPMKPPYYVDYSVLVSSPSKNGNMTAEIANAYYLVPRIMHYLHAGKGNKVMKSTAGDSYLIDLITYTLKYHCSGDMGEMASYHIHPAVQLYKSLNINYKNKKTCGDAGVDPIGATLAIMFMVNSAIAQTEKAGSDKKRIVNKIKKNAMTLRTVLYLIDVKKETASLMAHLGKIFAEKLYFVYC